MERRRWMSVLLPATALLAVVALLITYISPFASAAPEALQGKAAPDFSLKTTDGKDVKLSDLKGDVVVIDFWATWCPPCRLSLPHIQKLSENKDMAKQGLKVLAVNAREKNGQIEAFLKKNNYTFTVPVDADGKTMNDYQVQGIPTTIVVGRDGTVKAAFVGFNPQEGGKAMEKAVESALKEKA